MEKSIKKTKGGNEACPLLEGAVLNGAGVVKVIKKTKEEHKQIVQNFGKLCCNSKWGWRDSILRAMHYGNCSSKQGQEIAEEIKFYADLWLSNEKNDGDPG
ncbi:hypothetical protein OAF50_02630 [bacterium]|jgi:hypothetical protein|nr:hypothetical protein [bacterium]